VRPELKSPVRPVDSLVERIRPRASWQGGDLAEALLKRLFAGYRGALRLKLWDGRFFLVGAGPGNAPRDFTLVFRTPTAVVEAVLKRDPLRFAEAYFRDDLDIEGDLFVALELKDRLDEMKLSLVERLQVLASALKLRKVNRGIAPPTNPPPHTHAARGHTRAENRDAVRFHYDLSNDFYSAWLDRDMVYSCAYFRRSDDDLDTAQRAKLEHICRKLVPKPEELLLDVGCGWGALLIHAAKHYGVRGRGITLSENQLTLARERIAAAGVADRVSVALKDYRDLEGAEVFDKIVSVGMFEHVGIDNLPVYFATLQRLLKPHGLLLNHGITAERQGWTKTLSTEFINRYVFPDGQLDAVSNVLGMMERAHFEIADVEALRPHYALTLRHWVRRLEGRHALARRLVGEATYRVWRLYMAACALQFDRGDIGLYQILAVKRRSGVYPLPQTRAHLYRQSLVESL
jgi:cyclopropane-fatty-acyl-phospholipid synthase